MIEVFVQIDKNRHLVAEHSSDLSALEQLAVGQTYRAKLTRASGRSVKQHRRYWGGLIPAVMGASSQPLSREAAHQLIKIRTGHVKIIQLPSGEPVMIPSSISFERMGQDDFNHFFELAQAVAARDFGVSLEDLKREIEQATKPEGKAA